MKHFWEYQIKKLKEPNMESQLDLFPDCISQRQDNFTGFKTPKVKLGTLWGNDLLNCECKFIRLITKCSKCGKGNTINHFQIFTDAKMIEKGWENIEPFVWIATLPSCSRECENS